jgi:hypothetical protein
MRSRVGVKKNALDKENPEDIEMHEFQLTLPQNTYLNSYHKKYLLEGGGRGKGRRGGRREEDGEGRGKGGEWQEGGRGEGGGRMERY